MDNGTPTKNIVRLYSLILNFKLVHYHSNPHLGAGLLGGVANGVEQDESGNLSFDPTKFALGFLGGAAGSKSIERLAKNPKARAVLERIAAKRGKNMLESASKTQRGGEVDIQVSQHKEIFKNLRNRTKQVLGSLKGKDMINHNNRMIASVSSDGINKMISPKAVEKSLKNGYTKEEHFASVEHILELYEISTFLQSEKAINKSPDVIAYHKFIAHFKLNQKPASAKLTIRETYQAGNRIYSLELLELERS